MSANTGQFLVPKTPHNGRVKIGTTSAQVKSDGTSAGTGTDLMYCVFATGADGSFIQRVRFNVVASAAATNSIATVLRVYFSTVVTAEGAAAGVTTSADTFLIYETGTIIVSASHSTNAATYYDAPINTAYPTGIYILVSQHIAQTTNQQWQAVCFGGDY